MRCPQCGNEISAGFGFCTVCGYGVAPAQPKAKKSHLGLIIGIISGVLVITAHFL